MENIINILNQYHCPKWDDLPDFDLYMDQVLFYINTHLQDLYFDLSPDDKIITSNMVNNYVKNSIVKPPIRKHYKQYHLAFLIVVCILKRCYSLSEISSLIEIALVDRTIDEAYDSFSSCFDHYLHEVMEHKKIITEYAIENPDDKQILMMNVTKTIVYKIYSEMEIFNAPNKYLEQ